MFPGLLALAMIIAEPRTDVGKGGLVIVRPDPNVRYSMRFVEFDPSWRAAGERHFDPLGGREYVRHLEERGRWLQEKRAEAGAYPGLAQRWDEIIRRHDELLKRYQAPGR